MVKEYKAIDGTVEIKDDVVRVKNPVKGGKYPSLIVNDQNFEVFVNSNKVSGACVVTETDVIQVIPREVPPIARIEVDITPDKMKAILRIQKKPGKRYFLRDIKPSNSIVISGDYEEIPPPHISVEQCVSELIRNGVLQELILVEEIEKLLELLSGGSAVVAKGRPPIDGVDVRVEYYFSQHSFRNPDFDTDRRVDMMDHTVIPTVKIGQILAEKVASAIPGVDGMTVTGEVIRALPAKEAVFKAGKGAVILNNNRIVAAISGRPVLEKGVVSVNPVMNVPGDVDVSTGNIRSLNPVSICQI
ncbi:FapA family protein [Caldicoprobacter algeriensis]|uniref:flagellar assembly protein A n=1 Tax=Caldicoprobacter algeriensis TaxID=699281 RepID=UPI002079CE35|nr:FapA family protein [Caldicoprobacter algeriensis]